MQRLAGCCAGWSTMAGIRNMEATNRTGRYNEDIIETNI